MAVKVVEVRVRLVGGLRDLLGLAGRRIAAAKKTIRAGGVQDDEIFISYVGRRGKRRGEYLVWHVWAGDYGARNILAHPGRIIG